MYAAKWRTAQEHFVDDPRNAVAQADSLVTDATRVRGYPMGDFEQRAADLSVDHPTVVEDYRVAHAIAMRDAEGSASTEDLRKAMQHYGACSNTSSIPTYFNITRRWTGRSCHESGGPRS